MLVGMLLSRTDKWIRGIYVEESPPLVRQSLSSSNISSLHSANGLDFYSEDRLFLTVNAGSTTSTTSRLIIEPPAPTIRVQILI